MGQQESREHTVRGGGGHAQDRGLWGCMWRQDGWEEGERTVLAELLESLGCKDATPVGQLGHRKRPRGYL